MRKASPFTPLRLPPGQVRAEDINRNLDEIRRSHQAIISEYRNLSNGVGGDVLAGSFNYEELRALTSAEADEGDVANCYGRVTARDGGEGQFIYGDWGDDDDGCIVGKWKRIASSLTPDMYGAKCDGDGSAGNGTDNTAAMQAWANATAVHRLPLTLRGTNYYTGLGKGYRITDTIEFPEGCAATVKGGNNQCGAGYGVFSTIIWDAPNEKEGTGATIGVAVGAFSPLNGKVIGMSTVTGLSGMTTADVGKWILFPDIHPRGAYLTKIRAMQIVQYLSATSVNVDNITLLTGAGQRWIMQSKSALLFLGSENRCEGINIAVAPGRMLYSGWEDTRFPAGTPCTGNEFRNMACGANGVNAWALFATSHMNDYTSQGNPAGGIWENNGERNKYVDCFMGFCDVAGFYCPNLSGQALSTWFYNCAMTQVPIGIYCESGGFVAEKCHISTNGWACVYGLPGNLVEVALLDCISEASYRVLSLDGNTSAKSNARISGGYYASSGSAIDTTGFVRFGGTGTLRLDGTYFIGSGFYDPDLKIYVSNPDDGTTVRSGSVEITACQFPNNDPIYATSNCYVSIRSSYGFDSGNVLQPIRRHDDYPYGQAALQLRPAPRIAFVGDMGADIASASQITLPLTGGFAKITGTTAVDFIKTTANNAGRPYELYVTNAAGLTFNNNTAAPPAGFAPILTRSGAATAVSQRGTFSVKFDGTNWLETKP